MKSTMTCTGCGAESEYVPFMADGKEWFKPRLCPSCSESEAEARLRAKENERKAALEEEWNRICPASYRQTDPDHPLMDRQFLAGLMRYDHRTGRGIGLHGETGLRKTRMLFLLLKRLHFEGVRVLAVSAKRLAGCYSIMYGDSPECEGARNVIRRAKACQVLLLDDIGKEKFTDHAQAEFFDLVETRTSKLKPILWTANATGDDLTRMMSPDRGAPITRRLEDFCEVFDLSGL